MADVFDEEVEPHACMLREMAKLVGQDSAELGESEAGRQGTPMVSIRSERNRLSQRPIAPVRTWLFFRSV